MDVVKVENLTKKFKKRFRDKQEVLAVNNISFSIKKGEIFGFLGRNGAGKSTTIKILTGQLYPSSGQIEVCGINPQKEEKVLCEKIGVIPELPNLYTGLSVRKNLQFFSELYGIEKERADELITRFGLEEHQNKLVEKLSKGLKQKVIIARSIIHNPEILFMDEPTSGLDPNNAVEIKNIINEFKNQGKTIFLTTHNMNVAETMCDRVAIMKDGNILALNTPSELKAKYSDQKVQLETSEKVEMLTMDEFSRLDMSQIDDLKSVHSIEPSLEEVFIKITGE